MSVDFSSYSYRAGSKDSGAQAINDMLARTTINSAATIFDAASCGGNSTVGTIVNGLVLPFGMMALGGGITASGQSSGTQGASNASAMTLANTALAHASVVDEAIAEYDDAQKELTSLQARQEAVKEFDALQNEVTGIQDDPNNNDVITKYTELKDNIDNLTKIQTKAATIESEIAVLQQKADAPISTILPNGYATISGDGSNAVNEVESQKSKYGTGEAFNSVAFEQDCNAARNIQNAAEQKLLAQKQIENKKQELQNLKSEPGGNAIQGEVTSESIKTALAKAQSDLNKFAIDDKNSLKNGDKTINVLQYNDKLGKLTQAKEDQGVDFEAKIKAQKTVIATKKKAVVSQKAGLEATKRELQTLAVSMQSVIKEQSEADQVKTARDKYNQTHKRGFFKKLFGTGKDATQKANDKSYKKEKSEAQAASAAFAQAYSFKADTVGLQQIQDAIKEIDAKLARIATIAAET